MKNLYALLIGSWLAWIPMTQAHAACKPAWEPLSEMTPMPSFVRDLADGRWQFGFANQVAELDCSLWGQDKLAVLEAGLYGTKDTDSRASDYGVHAGVPFAFLSAGANKLSNGLVPDLSALLTRASNKWKPLAYANSFLSVDGFAGYRPQLVGDLQHHFVYGFMLRLNVKWTAKEGIAVVNGGL